MKIVVATRTRNEERNIVRFCLGYRWADKILIADGGSDDETISIASSFCNVEVRCFNERVERNGYWRNPHGKHINFLINWAKEENVDWVILDDADCFPTRDLRLNSRTLFDRAEASGAKAIFLHRLYIYLDKLYCPEMNKPGQSLWAWRLDSGIVADERNPWDHVILNVPKERYLLDHPNSCLHRYYPDEETIERKLKFYRESGQHPSMLHPLQTQGVMAELLEWMRE